LTSINSTSIGTSASRFRIIIFISGILLPLFDFLYVFFQVCYCAAVGAEEGRVFGLDDGPDAFVVPGVGAGGYE